MFAMLCQFIYIKSNIIIIIGHALLGHALSDHALLGHALWVM